MNKWTKTLPCRTFLQHHVFTIWKKKSLKFSGAKKECCKKLSDSVTVKAKCREISAFKNCKIKS